jgi:hypothetical protein
MAKKPESPQFPDIPKEVVDFLILDERLEPGSLRSKKWEALRHDGRFMEAIHGAILLSTELPTDEMDAESFLRGVAFGLQAVRDTLDASVLDDSLLHNTTPNN